PSAWAPKEAKAATAAMERKRAVLFMMDKSFKKSVSKKPGGKQNKNCFNPGFGESPCGFGSSMG
ncbi:hypothetical protein, partial [Acidovorax sp. GW101-3H11]|uniref:hypothetical protein n=1 Tax=Acidovorax sp. GW101-3H11 TaxID=1813946 RepID=UPI001A7EE04E